MMHKAIENPFKKFWGLGYRNLLPVVPPDAEISPDSRLSASARGKSPGVKGVDGLWRGINMHRVLADETDLDRWFSWGAGVGMRGDENLFFVDVDHMGEKEAKRIYHLAKTHLGVSWPRVGQAPKFALPYRSTALVRSCAIKFDTAPINGKEPGLDIISTSPHCVVSGTHASTGLPYTWPKGTPAYNELSEVTPEQVEAFLAAVCAEFPAKSRTAVKDRDIPEDQESLRGNPDILKSAMRDMPNPQSHFNSRGHYIAMGLALKSAFGPEHKDDAFDLYLQWCGRWDGGVNDVEKLEKDWERMKPPFTLGADYIYSKAEQLTDWRMPTALQVKKGLEFFDPLADDAPDALKLFEPIRNSVFQPLSILHGLEVPEREWVVPDLIPDNTVTMLAGDGGTGKSLLAQQLAVAAILGKDWIGNKVKQGRVIVISAEDDEDELHRRFSTIVRHYGASMADMDDLIFRSLAGEDAVLGAPHGKAGLIKPTPLFAELEAEAEKQRPVLIVLDTLADLFGGSEIDRVQTRQFVGLLRGLSIRNSCASLLLSHPSVAGMQSGTGTSGSTAWSNSVRSRLYIERITEDGVEPNPDARRLTTKKANYGRTGGVTGLVWANGVFVQDDSVAGGVGPMATLEGNLKAQTAFLKNLRKFAEQGRFVSANPGPSYAPAAFVKAGKAEGMTKKALASAMEGLLAAGRLRVERYGPVSRSVSRLVEVDDPFGGVFD
jgi:RecA-family ATPase